MTHPLKGSIIISNGFGKVTYIEPGQSNMVLMTDSNDPNKVKFADSSVIIGETTYKSVTAINLYVTTSTYTTIMYPSIPGEKTKRIKSIRVTTYQTTSGNDYHQIRVYDQTNNKIIAEATFTNNKAVINNMGKLNNLPDNEAILEIQALRNSGNKTSRVYLLECAITYYN